MHKIELFKDVNIKYLSDKECILFSNQYDYKLTLKASGCVRTLAQWVISGKTLNKYLKDKIGDTWSITHFKADKGAS
jgi:hypothetical protein